MYGLIVPTGNRIAPFGDPPSATPVLATTLAGHQREVLAAVGVRDVREVDPDTAAPEGPCLVLADDLLVGVRLVEDFVRAARDCGARRAVLALRPGAFTRDFGVLQDLPETDAGEPLYPLYWLADGGPLPAGPDGCTPLVLSPKERLLTLPVPAQWFGQEEIEVPITARPALRVRHWLHVLFANRLAGGESWLRLPRWRLVLRVLWAIVRAGIPTVPRVLRRLSTFGRGCRVHPTAVVEASVLGDGVRVGPHAVVRFSHVGAGSLLMDGANVAFSTLGERCTVSTHCGVSFSVLYRQASAAQSLLQLSVIGERAVTTGMGYLTDMKMDGGEIRVRHEGRLVSSGQRFLGSAVGHRAVLGSGFWLAHGREVGNGYVIVRSPESILHRVPEGLPEGVPLAVRNGTLEPLK